MLETCFNHCANEDFVTFSSSEQKWLNRFRKDAEEYPDEVTVQHVNEDGSMVVRYPYSWVRIPKKPSKKNLTEEQRAEMSARFEKVRASRKPR